MHQAKQLTSGSLGSTQSVAQLPACPLPLPWKDTLIPHAFLFISCLSWRQKYWVLVSLSDFKAGRKGQLCENEEVSPGEKGGQRAAQLIRSPSRCRVLSRGLPATQRELIWPGPQALCPPLQLSRGDRQGHITRVAAFQIQGQNVGQERGTRAPQPPNQKPGRERGPGGGVPFSSPLKRSSKSSFNICLSPPFLKRLQTSPTNLDCPTPHYPQGVQATHMQALQLRARSCATGREGHRGSQSHGGRGRWSLLAASS